jgi:hypothetical protein
MGLHGRMKTVHSGAANYGGSRPFEAAFERTTSGRHNWRPTSHTAYDASADRDDGVFGATLFLWRRPDPFDRDANQFRRVHRLVSSHPPVADLVRHFET